MIATSKSYLPLVKLGRWLEAPAEEPAPEEEEEVNTQQLQDLRKELEALRAKVMGPVEVPKAMTWREAVNTIGYPEAKKQYPDLYAEAVRGAK